MKTITQITEKRINNMVLKNHKFGNVFNDLLNQMKSNKGFYGTAIKEMKKYDCFLENEIQINICKTDMRFFYGLSCIFPDLIITTNCLDLCFVTIKDFNKLVKLVDSLDNNGWGIY